MGFSVKSLFGTAETAVIRFDLQRHVAQVEAVAQHGCRVGKNLLRFGGARSDEMRGK